MLPTLLGLPPKAQFEDVVRKVNQLVQELTNVLLNLDTLNIIELNAEVITALSITAEKIATNAITADKIDVDELSAISANLGTITAGSITTNANINVGTDVTIGNNLNMGQSDYTGSKKITWSGEAGKVAELQVMSGDISIRADGFITLSIGSSMGLVVGTVNATNLKASGSITLGGQPVAISSAVSGTWYVSSTPGGTPDVALTFTDGVLTSAV